MHSNCPCSLISKAHLKLQNVRVVHRIANVFCGACSIMQVRDTIVNADVADAALTLLDVDNAGFDALIDAC